MNGIMNVCLYISVCVSVCLFVILKPKQIQLQIYTIYTNVYTDYWPEPNSHDLIKSHWIIFFRPTGQTKKKKKMKK